MKYQLGEYNTEVIETILDQVVKQVPTNSFWVIDNKVASLYPIFNNLPDTKLLVNAEETNKNLKMAEEIFNWLKYNKVNRQSTIVAVGGGITTDLTGWVASNYMRGCNLMHIPTTLIGMIDAAIGGKTAINFNQTKNLVGSFYPAGKVFIIPGVLQTLQEKEIQAGLAELLKMALLPESRILKLLIELKSEWKTEFHTLINMSIEQKMLICQRDLRDTGERRSLNLGHTFAHVIESASNYQIEHGRAVAIGIIKAARLSYELKLIARERYDFIIKLIRSHYPANYLQLEMWIINAISNKGKEFYENDKKSKLILFSGENDIAVFDTIEWNKFKNIIIEVS
ncbi:MAG: 3-dehydroquinate synthase family protein [Candidatus Stygibacter frigidus]|nr:3-dehydroquinate synthase family protein [Candidatus Stygibacter frigidus]